MCRSRCSSAAWQPQAACSSPMRSITVTRLRRCRISPLSDELGDHPGHGGAPDAQHLGQQFLGDRQVGLADAVLRGQQPAAGAGLDRVQRGADRGLQRPHQQRPGMQRQQDAQRRAGLRQAGQGGGLDPPGGTGHLHLQMAEARQFGQVAADHALGTDRHRLRGAAAMVHRHQGDDGGGAGERSPRASPRRSRRGSGRPPAPPHRGGVG